MKTRKIYQVGWVDLRQSPPLGGELQTYSRREAYAFRAAKRAEGAEADIFTRESFQ